MIFYLNNHQKMFTFIGNWIEWMTRHAIVFLTNFLSVKVIRDDRGTPFLYRYHLFAIGPDGPGMCIHHFVKSDPDRGYHDHPWKNAVSFILSGGYQERILDLSDKKSFNTYYRKRFSFNWLNGVNTFHRVMIDEGSDAWTIFAFRGRSKTWGMISLDGEYHAMSTQISDTDGGWWNVLGTGYQVNHHVEHPGKVIATVDIVVLAESKILLIERGKDPYKGSWAFPGGRIEEKDRDTKTAALRELQEETQLEASESELEYVTTIGNNTRDPRGFCLTNVFLCRQDVIPQNVKAGDDAVNYQWFDLDNLPSMAFDHYSILMDIIE